MPVVTAAVTDNTGPEQLSRGDGAYIGLAGGTEPVGFWGKTSSQASGAAQIALQRGVAMGTIATYASSNSPGQVVSLSSAEKTLTTYVGANGTGTGPTHSLLTTDFIAAVNKPANQAGIGVGNARVSASGAIAVTFTNYSTSAITATAGEKYSWVGIRGLATLTASLTPTAVASNTVNEQFFTVPGLRVGEVVVVSKPTSQVGLDIGNARVAAANSLAVQFVNVSGAGITPTAGETYTVTSFGQIDAVANNILIGAYFGAPASVSGTGASEQAITLTNLTNTDAVVGISKPSAQTNLGIVGQRVSGANSLGVTYANFQAAQSPATNEVYEVQIFRPAPAAPCLTYAVTLTPAAVGPNTTAAQDFTVTGLIASSIVAVNKPSFTAGLTLAGTRVSAANILEITYGNCTAATITPPAETYLIANFQQQFGDAGTAWIHSFSPQQYQAVMLDNAIRSAMFNMGQIAGA